MKDKPIDVLEIKYVRVPTERQTFWFQKVKVKS